MLNGVAREATLRGRISEQRAHQVSTLTLMLSLTRYIHWLQRRVPLPTTGTALGVGASWAAMTVLFEFALGRSRGLSMSEAAADYNIRRGRLWPLVLLTMTFAPAASRWLIRRQHTG
ncbi:hypothetical protein ACVBEQ_23345 [Nakamurella sp. GG22]